MKTQFKRTILAFLSVVLLSASIIGGITLYVQKGKEVTGWTFRDSHTNNFLLNDSENHTHYDYSFIDTTGENNKVVAKYLPPNSENNKKEYGLVKLANSDRKIPVNQFVDSLEKTNKENPLFRIKTSYFNFDNRYFTAVNPDDWVKFVWWFVGRNSQENGALSYGPEAGALKTFQIMPGLANSGSGLTLGRYSNKNLEKAIITFYPDSFFGFVSIYSDSWGSESTNRLTNYLFSTQIHPEDEYSPKFEYKNFPNEFTLKQIEEILDLINKINFANDKLKNAKIDFKKIEGNFNTIMSSLKSNFLSLPLDVKFKLGDVLTKSTKILSEGDNKVNRVESIIENFEKAKESIKKLSEWINKDKIVKPKNRLSIIKEKIEKNIQEFESINKLILKIQSIKKYKEIQNHPLLRGSYGTMGQNSPSPYLLVPSSTRIINGKREKLYKILAEHYTLRDKDPSKKSLIEKLSQKFPRDLTKMEGPFIRKNSKGKFSLGVGKNYRFAHSSKIGMPKILKVLNPKFQGMGFDFLKSVSLHEYGHHHTMINVQDFSSTSILANKMTLRGTGEHEVSLESVKDYLSARSKGLKVVEADPYGNVAKKSQKKFQDILNVRFRLPNGEIEKQEEIIGKYIFNKNKKWVPDKEKNKKIYYRAFKKSLDELKEKYVDLYNKKNPRRTTTIYNAFIMNSFDKSSITINPPFDINIYRRLKETILFKDKPFEMISILDLEFHDFVDKISRALNAFRWITPQELIPEKWIRKINGSYKTQWALERISGSKMLEYSKSLKHLNHLSIYKELEHWWQEKQIENKNNKPDFIKELEYYFHLYKTNLEMVKDENLKEWLRVFNQWSLQYLVWYTLSRPWEPITKYTIHTIELDLIKAIDILQKETFQEIIQGFFSEMKIVNFEDFIFKPTQFSNFIAKGAFDQWWAKWDYDKWWNALATEYKTIYKDKWANSKTEESQKKYLRNFVTNATKTNFMKEFHNYLYIDMRKIQNKELKFKNSKSYKYINSLKTLRKQYPQIWIWFKSVIKEEDYKVKNFPKFFEKFFETKIETFFDSLSSKNMKNVRKRFNNTQILGSKKAFYNIKNKEWDTISYALLNLKDKGVKPKPILQRYIGSKRADINLWRDKGLFMEANYQDLKFNLIDTEKILNSSGTSFFEFFIKHHLSKKEQEELKVENPKVKKLCKDKAKLFYLRRILKPIVGSIVDVYIGWKITGPPKSNDLYAENAIVGLESESTIFSDYTYTFAELMTRDYMQIIYSHNNDYLKNTHEFLRLSTHSTSFSYFIDKTLTDLYNVHDASATNYFSTKIADNWFRLSNLETMLPPKMQLSNFQKIFYNKVKDPANGIKIIFSYHVIHNTIFGSNNYYNNGLEEDRQHRHALGWNLYNEDGSERYAGVNQFTIKGPRGQKPKTWAEAYWFFLLKIKGINSFNVGRNISNFHRNLDDDKGYVWGYLDTQQKNFNQNKPKYLVFKNKETGKVLKQKIFYQPTHKLFYLKKQGDVNSRHTLADEGFVGWSTQKFSFGNFLLEFLSQGDYEVYFAKQDFSKSSIKVSIGDKKFITENNKFQKVATSYFYQDFHGKISFKVKKKFSVG